MSNFAWSSLAHCRHKKRWSPRPRAICQCLLHIRGNHASKQNEPENLTGPEFQATCICARSVNPKGMQWSGHAHAFQVMCQVITQRSSEGQRKHDSFGASFWENAAFDRAQQTFRKTLAPVLLVTPCQPYRWGLASLTDDALPALQIPWNNVVYM